MERQLGDVVKRQRMEYTLKLLRELHKLKGVGSDAIKQLEEKLKEGKK